MAYPFTLKQAASYLGISAKTLYGIVARGEIDHLRTCRGRRDGPAIGGQGRAAGRIKFSREGLEEWIAARPVADQGDGCGEVNGRPIGLARIGDGSDRPAAVGEVLLSQGAPRERAGGR